VDKNKILTELRIFVISDVEEENSTLHVELRNRNIIMSDEYIGTLTSSNSLFSLSLPLTITQSHNHTITHNHTHHSRTPPITPRNSSTQRT
jgi:hypothetical protein